MHIVMRIIIVLAVLVACILVFAATKPGTFHIRRSIIITAPKEKIFPFVNDFHNWKDWAPQDKEDATMSRTFSGSASGRDAVSDWNSKGSAGKGRMVIIESAPFTNISIKTDFVQPFEAHNFNEFSFETSGASTRVTWTMNGTNLYIMKIMSVLGMADSFIGKHFEKGLQNLKSVSER
jgi:hypothetical protein